MEFGGSASDTVSSGSELDMANLGKNKKFIDSFVDWKTKTSIEKKLILGVLHRRGHKNFEEKE